MTSINLHIEMQNWSVYGATKGALPSLARTLSGELISLGIRLNAFSGGPIDTPLYAKLGMGELKALAEQIPAKGFRKPLEIADTVLIQGPVSLPCIRQRGQEIENSASRRKNKVSPDKLSKTLEITRSEYLARNCFPQD